MKHRKTNINMEWIKMHLNGYEVYYLFLFCIDPYRFSLFKLSSKILWLKLLKKVIEVCMHAQSCPTLWDPMDSSNQAPLPIEFSREKYWSELPFSSPGDLLYPGIKPVSPAWVGRFFTTMPPGKPLLNYSCFTVLDSAAQKTETAMHMSPLFWISFPFSSQRHPWW